MLSFRMLWGPTDLCEALEPVCGDLRTCVRHLSLYVGTYGPV